MTTRKLLPVLSEMPWHIKEQIVHSADSITHMELELCSKEYRNLVEDAPSFYEHLIIKVSLESTQISVPSLTFGRKKTFLMPQYSHDCLLYDVANYIAKILQHPKSSIGKLEINVYHWKDSIIPDMFRFLHAIRGSLLSVKNISMTSTMLSKNVKPGFLEHLEPRALQTISLTNSGQLSTTDLSLLAGTVQWGMARKLEVNKFFLRLAYNKWAHFEFDSINLIRLPVETARGIMENFFRKPNWKRVQVMYSQEEGGELKAYLGSLGFEKGEEKKIENPLNSSEVISVLSTKRWFWAKRHH